MAVPSSKRYGGESRVGLQHLLRYSKRNWGSVLAKSRIQHFKMLLTVGGCSEGLWVICM